LQQFDARVKFNDARVKFNDARVKSNVDRTQLGVRRAQFRDHGNTLVVGRFGGALVHERRQRNKPLRAARFLWPRKIGETVNSYQCTYPHSPPAPAQPFSHTFFKLERKCFVSVI